MALSDEGFWASAWKPVVAAAAVGAAAWFWGALVAAWAAVLGHLSADVTRSSWQWYLLALLSAHSTTYWAWRLMRASRLSHRRFNQDKLLGARWRWMYDISGAPVGIKAYCAECDMALVYEETAGSWRDAPGHVSLHCERCNTAPVSMRGDLEHLQGRVRREIERLVRTGEWAERAGRQ